MTNKDDQQPDDENSDVNDDELLFPELDDRDLTGTAEENVELEYTIDETAEPEAIEDDELVLPDFDDDGLKDITVESVEIEDNLDEVVEAEEIINDESGDLDEEIINLSDEEFQQEFENLEEEGKETEQNTETSTSTIHVEPAANENTQYQSWGSSLAAVEAQIELGNDLDLDLDEKENENELEKEIDMEIENIPAIENDPLDIETVTTEEPTQEYFQQLNFPKSIVGVVITTIVVGAIILFIGFGSNEPPAVNSVAVSAGPTPFNTDEPLTESVQILPEEITLPEVADETPVIAEPPILEEDSALVRGQAEDVVATVLSDVEDNAPPASDNSTVQEEQPADIEPVIVANQVEENIAEELTPVVEEEPPPSTTPRAVQTTSEEVDETSIVLQEATGDYYIIVASFSSEALALEHTNAMSESEESPVIIPPFGESDRYRVAISSCETLTEAQANIAQYQSAYGAGIWPLRYTPANLGTVLSERTGNTYVIVSSFATEESARNHADSLTSAEIEPLIIPPFNQSDRYRVAIFSYETLTEAQEVLPQHRAIYGEAIWLLRF
jgi:hypothetical protein